MDSRGTDALKKILDDVGMADEEKRSWVIFACIDCDGRPGAQIVGCGTKFAQHYAYMIARLSKVLKNSIREMQPSLTESEVDSTASGAILLSSLLVSDTDTSFRFIDLPE